jgi:hypothetical protein
VRAQVVDLAAPLAFRAALIRARPWPPQNVAAEVLTLFSISAPGPAGRGCPPVIRLAQRNKLIRHYPQA